MYGSDPKERFVGPGAVRGALTRWKLAFDVKDGVRAGVTKAKTVAWIGANLSARDNAGKDKGTYRVTAIYEKQGEAWKLVVLHFST
jgi:hypothetical protein